MIEKFKLEHTTIHNLGCLGFNREDMSGDQDSEMLKYLQTPVGWFTFEGMRASDEVYARTDEGRPQVLSDTVRRGI